ncbi:MAG TPA: hypothetical protein VI548_11905 [Chitinophagaceae bacterium]|nr:hypothetical protein [Chitinophagaceae bacterium]
MDTIGIISIIVALLIAITPFLWRRYFSRPELTIEIIKGGGVSSNVGVSNKNDITKGYIEGNNAIFVFRIIWQFKVVIRNNSEHVAYYPKIILDTTNPKFTNIEKLNELIPISTKETIELKAEYAKYEECQGRDRTDVANFPDELKNIRILLEYKNSSKIKNYTLYTQSDAAKNIFLARRPKFFKGQ